MDKPLAQAMTPEAALAAIEARGDDAPWALAWLAAYNFAHDPDDVESHQTAILSRAVHIAGESSDEAQDLARRATLAGTMNVTYGLLGRETLRAVQAGETDIYFGPAECYVFYMPDGSGRPLIAPYPPNSGSDMFMRTVVMFADRAQHVGAAFPQYKPIWNLEQGIRQAIEDEARPYVPGDRQFVSKDLPPSPLSRNRILQTASVFWRNIMHGLLIINGVGPSQDAAARAHDSIEAYEAAAAFPKAHQRRAMGVSTTYLPYRPASALELIKDSHGRPRFRGLAHEPRKPSLCTGRGTYEGSGDWPIEASSMAALVDLGALVAKQTIWANQSGGAPE